MRFVPLFLLCVFPLSAAEPAPSLTPKEIADGWLMLYDGESTFGWKIEGESSISKEGHLVLGGIKETKATSTLRLASGQVALAWRGEGKNPSSVSLAGSPLELLGRNNLSGLAFNAPKAPAVLEITVPAGSKFTLERAVCLPTELKPLFNGKDITGWKTFPGDKYKSVFSVTKEGWLNVKDGPGDLQTEGKYSNFVLQLECFSNGAALNSGVFFRCLPDQYQNGYEMQIQNGIKDGDRNKPADFGTGAIYRRIPARKVVSNDKEWFAMTLVANGKQLRTFVNGHPVVDWTDDRPADENPRKGNKTGAGHLSIQGHDPTTDLSFRNIRIAEMK